MKESKIINQPTLLKIARLGGAPIAMASGRTPVAAQPIGIDGSASMLPPAAKLVQACKAASAAAAEELSSTAEEMSAPAESLKQLMAFFRVAGSKNSAVGSTAPVTHGSKASDTEPAYRPRRQSAPPASRISPARPDARANGAGEFKHFA